MVLVNDLEGVYRMLHWLSFVPAVAGGSLPIVLPSDPVDRPVDIRPSKSPYDPRLLFCGNWEETSGQWESGFFDKDSWSEIMHQWAQTVITGRARLGGIPVGVIAAETRMIEFTVPADPANANSEAKVWFILLKSQLLTIFCLSRRYNKLDRSGTQILPTKPHKLSATSIASNCRYSYSPIGVASQEV